MSGYNIPAKDAFNDLSQNMVASIIDNQPALDQLKQLESQRSTDLKKYQEKVIKERSAWIHQRALELFDGEGSNTLDYRPPSIDDGQFWKHCKEQAAIEIDAEILQKKQQISEQCRQVQQQIIEDVQHRRKEMREQISQIKQACAELKQANAQAFELKKHDYIALAKQQGITEPEVHIYKEFKTMQANIDNQRYEQIAKLHKQHGFDYTAKERKLSQSFNVV